MKSKRQTTRAKLDRERLVQERRALKLEKKRARHDESAAGEAEQIAGNQPPETAD